MKRPSEMPCPNNCKREDDPKKPVMVKIGGVCPNCLMGIPHGSESTLSHMRIHALNISGKTRKHIPGEWD